MMETRACLGLRNRPRRSVTSLPHIVLMRRDELDSCNLFLLLWRASVLVSSLASMSSVCDQSQNVPRHVNGSLNHACNQQSDRAKDRHDLLRMRRQKANQARLARIQALQPRLLRQQLAGLRLCAHACMHTCSACNLLELVFASYEIGCLKTSALVLALVPCGWVWSGVCGWEGGCGGKVLHGERIYMVVSLKANRATLPPSLSHARKHTHTCTSQTTKGVLDSSSARHTRKIHTSYEISPSLLWRSNGLLQRAAMVLQAVARRLLRTAGRWDDKANSEEANWRSPPVDHDDILAGIFLIPCYLSPSRSLGRVLPPPPCAPFPSFSLHLSA